jgi:hypothetical protein
LIEAAAIEFYVRDKGGEYNKHDKGYKYLLFNKRTFLEFLRSFVENGWVEKIYEDNIVRVDKKYVLQDFAQKEADIVYRGKIIEEEDLFFVLIELQSRVDFTMPYRLLLYMMEIWRDVFRNTPKKIRERKNFRLPPVIPIVLYNGKYTWTAAKSFKDMIAQNSLFSEYIPDFQYILVDINRFNEEKLLEVGNLISSVFYIEQKRDTEVIERLTKLVSTLDTLDNDDKQTFKNWLKAIVSQGLSKHMRKKVSEIIEKNEEVDSMISNLTKAIIEDRKKSKQEGIAEGMAKGKAEVLIKYQKI